MRAGHTGSIPCTPMVWNGDQHVDWSRDQGIRTVIPASLSLAMSGVGVCHSDVGGYTSIAHMKRSRELLARWAELCCFSPLMRSHEGNRPDVNVQFDCDPEMLHHFANLGRLRELLAPYLRAQLRQYADKGTPVMRPLFYHYKGDGFFDITDEYLLGRDILVAPILRPGAQSRTCVLPNDEWVHLFSGETYLGGTYEVEAPLGRPPVFVRKASEFAALLVPGTNEMEVEGKEA
ncbi:MAG: hypothetical protein IJH83_00800 [Coriobacteriales bacterium]|nr:hypothetical protein [Coriobacteriales bacterium]